MKRKTNLFYTTGSDANFLTFSNYPESMTGNFLSVPTKLFPTAFMCIHAPGLNDRSNFIKYLAAYYENKLAFLRDACIAHNYNIEDRLKPLNYLIEAFDKYFGVNSWSITHIGQITEQDYNGVYSDSICIIDSSEKQKISIIKNSNQLEYRETFTDSLDYLYGWYFEDSNHNIVYDGTEAYRNVKPVFDISSNVYTYDSNLESIRIVDDSVNKEAIKFNIIIPLYDIVNTDYDKEIISLGSEIDLNTNNLYTHFVPYGIWFSGDKPVELERYDEKYKPCWSLTISSQFKPFPYSEQKVSQIDQTARTASFNTFAQLLIKQNEFIDRFNELNKQISNLNNRVVELESTIKNFGTLNNIDKLSKQLSSLQTQINALSKEIKHE